MGTSDGHILGTTKIVDHGPAAMRYNFVILGEGYQASQINQYHTDVQNFVDTLYATAPFNQLWCGINIYRVDVTSTDSGAYDPPTCGDGSTGSGPTPPPHTYFDATFCSGGGIRRLLTVNDSTALNVATTQVPQVQMTLVIVNTTEYGGSGPDSGSAVVTFSLASSDIGIHEMGHGFGLADEYSTYAGCSSGETGHDHYTGGEPTQPNLTIDTNRATNKWRNLILPTTPMPTTKNADCTQCDTQASPVPVGTVGTFEGGSYDHCGCYRPEYNCRMRELGNPFCAVCQQAIQQVIQPYTVPTAVTLTTPSIAFTNIPEGIGGTGVTTYRAIVFDITSCSSITLHFTAGPTGGFGTPFGTSVVVPSSEFTQQGIGRLWLSYTSTTAGASSVGSVTVHCDETNQSWVIPIVANTVARPKSAVAFVFDHSGSMIEDAGDGTTKVQKLREAANIFVSVMLQGDGIGIVRFDDTAQILMQITDVGPANSGTGRTTAQGIINSPQLDPAGDTSIGDGVVKGKQILDAAQALGTPHYDVTAMVVLTDGEENTPPFLADVGSSITANTFAIGLGTPANISTVALNTLTQGHNGYLLITGTMTTDQSTRLEKYFLQILAGITNANVVLDPQGYLVYGSEQSIPFTVTEADIGIDVILLSPAPYYIDFQLQTPDGQRITPTLAASEPTLQFVSTSKVSYYRFSLPALPTDPVGSRQGTWQAILSLSDRSRGINTAEFVSSQSFVARALPYNLLVHSYSNLQFHAYIQQNSFEPGATVTVVASLTEYDYPVEGRATVGAEITSSNGNKTTITLTESGGGQFEGTFTATLSGLYTVRVIATGSTLRDTPFTREQTLTAAVYPSADQNPPGTGTGIGGILCWLQGRDKRLCELLLCLLSEKVIGGQLRQDLLARGVNFTAFEACLRIYCGDTSPCDCQTPEPGKGAKTTSSLSNIDVAQALQQPEVRRMLGEIVREVLAQPAVMGFAELPKQKPHTPRAGRKNPRTP